MICAFDEHHGAGDAADDVTLAAGLVADDDLVRRSQFALHGEVADEDAVSSRNMGVLHEMRAARPFATDAGVNGPGALRQSDYAALYDDVATGKQCDAFDRAVDVDVTRGFDGHAGMDVSGHIYRSREVDVTGVKVDVLDGIDGLHCHLAFSRSTGVTTDRGNQQILIVRVNSRSVQPLGECDLFPWLGRNDLPEQGQSGLAASRRNAPA